MMLQKAEQAIILAAGRGSRMGELTSDKPKCLSELAGRRLLDWQLAALGAANIKSVTVVRGYKKELLSAPNYLVLDNSDWANTNMVATLRCATNLLRKSPCLVSYSDIVYHPNHVSALANAEGDIAISYDVAWEKLWSARFENPLADAETFKQEDGLLKTIGDKAYDMSCIQGQYMGLLKFTPTGWAKVEALMSILTLEEQNRIDMTGLLRRLLFADINIKCVPVNGMWCEVDSESDVRLYEKLLKASALVNTRWDHDWRWQ